MEINEEFLNKISLLGSLGTTKDNICLLLELKEADKEMFLAEFENIKSKIRQAYDLGYQKSEITIGRKLFEEAQQGDLKAIELYLEFKKRNYFNEQENIAKAEASKTKAEAETAQIKLTNLQNYQELKHEMFGV